MNLIEPSPDLQRLQRKLIDAITPYAADKPTAEAFALRPGGKTISQTEIPTSRWRSVALHQA